jgi:putative protein-disulfide isomerase
MTEATLHCIYDPFCGWCYGAAPLLGAAGSLEGLTVRLHGGGMMAGSRRQAVTESLRGFVMQHDQRIAAMSGQPFGQGYVDGLLRDTGAVFDSEPPTAAIVAADALGKAVAMLDRVQKAHFVEGQRIADALVLANLAEEIGIDRVAFQAEFVRVSGGVTQQHIADSRAFLQRVGGAGFPTFVLERAGAQEGGRFEVLGSAPFLGRPEAWRQALHETLA